MYNRFSELYDRLVFDIDYADYASKILAELHRRGFEGGSLLEIGCGTGNLTRHLCAACDHVFALDISEEMLGIAWGKLQGCDNLILAEMDVCELQAPQQEAACGMLDTFNYILDEADLALAFSRIAEHLPEGGAFIFDMNSRRRLIDEIGSQTWVYEKDDIFYTWESEVDGDLVDSWLTFFVRDDDGRYHRIDEGQTQRYYPPETVLRLLEAAGFEEIEIMDFDTMAPVNEATNRMMFAAIKKNIN